jgi:hypothetical protein
VKARNDIRRALKAAFQTVSVVCLPQPHSDVNARAVLLTETSQQFQDALSTLRTDLAQRLLEPSVFGGCNVSAALLKSVMPALVDAVNRGSQDICPRTMMQSIHVQM